MTRRPRPAAARLVETGEGLRITTPDDGNRFIASTRDLLLTQPGDRLVAQPGQLSTAAGRLVEPAAGLLITRPAALTAAAGEDEPHPDPWHEQRLDAAADLARWEPRIEAAARRALSAWTAVCASAVLDDQYLTAAPDGGLPPDPGAIPALAATWRKIADSQIVRLLSDLLTEVFGRYLSDERTVSARAWQESYLEQVSNRLVRVADSTFDLVRTVVQDGIADGASIPTIRERVQESLDAGGETSWANRAQVIARTETIGAYNGGTLAVHEVIAEETGDPLDKAWLATIDPRTRDSHFRADGQRVPLGQPFRVGGHDLDHPGDPLGPPEEVIQCRCTMLFLDPDEPTPDVVDRGFRDPAEVAAEIARRADLDPAVVRAYDDPDAALQAAAAAPAADGALRPAEPYVARMDAIYRASYAADADDLLLAGGDEARVDPLIVAAVLEGVLTAAGGFGGLSSGNYYDPNQKRDENGKWTKHGVGISITVKDGADEQASFAAPTEALARVTFEHELTGSDGKTYRTRVTSSAMHPNLSEVSVAFEDAAGNRIGRAERMIKQGDAGPEVKHSLLEIKPEYQGLGLGSEFNRRAEAVYRAAGASHVTVYAGSVPSKGFVGGYVWARRGFSWADPTGPKKVAGQLRAQSLIAGKTSPELEDAIARLESAELFTFQDPSMPTPWDVSELPDGIGKAALLQEGWNGVRWLPADAPAEDGTQDGRAGGKLAEAGKPDAPAPAVDGAQDAARTPAPAAPLTGDAAYQAAASALTRDLTWEERLTLDHYTAAGAYPLNAHLRGITVHDDFIRDEFDKQAGQLAAVALASPLPAAIQVRRGVSNAQQILPPGVDLTGSVITDAGFASTTTDPGMADVFTKHTHAGGSGAPDDAVMFTLNVPAGYPVLPVNQALAGVGVPAPPGWQSEIILPPGASWRVTSDTRDENGLRLITAEVLPHGGQEAADAVAAAEPAPTPARSAPTPAPTGPAPLEGSAAYQAAQSALTRDLTTGERAALNSYTGAGADALNQHLRAGGTDPRLQTLATDLAGLAAASPAPERLRVYRGIHKASAFLAADDLTGSVLADGGFVSTTTDRGIADTYALDTYGEDSGPEDAVVLDLTVPVGHPIVPVDQALVGRGKDASTSYLAFQSEVILPPGSAVRVTSDTRDASGIRVLTGEVVPAAAPAPAEPAPKAKPKPAPAPKAVAPLTAAKADKLLSSLVTEDISGAQLMALTGYTGNTYREINRNLRSDNREWLHADLQADVAALIEVAEAHRLTKPITVMRGMRSDVDGLRDVSVGAVVTDLGFISTTTDPAVADNFAAGYGSSKSGTVLMNLTVPEGFPVIPADQLVAGAGEKLPPKSHREFEVVLPPGASFRITRDEVVDGRRVVDAEVLPYEPAASRPDATDIAAADAPEPDVPAAPTAPAAPGPLTGPDADRVLSAMVTEDLDDEEDLALNSYITAGYRSINDHLRGIDVADPSKGDAHRAVLDEVAALRSIADAHRLPEPIKAYRGLYAVDALLPARGEAVGSVLTDPGFMSASISPTAAGNFGQGENAVLLEFTVPAGHPAIPVDQLFAGAGGELSPDDEREFEVVLPPSTSMRITGETQDADGRRVLTAEVLPYAAPAPAVLEDPAPAPEPPTAPTAATPPVTVPAATPPTLGEVNGVKLTPARLTALDYFAAPAGQRTGKRPATPTAQVLVDAGLLQRDDRGRISITPAGEQLRAGTTPLPTPPPAVAVARVTEYDPAAAALAASQADRSTTGGQFMAFALEDAGAYGDLSNVLVAENGDGQPVAALSLVQHLADPDEEFDRDFTMISYLGSTTSGGGRALVEEARQRAIETNERLYLEPTVDAEGFWAHMGAVPDPYDEGAPFWGFPETYMGQEPDEDPPAVPAAVIASDLDVPADVAAEPAATDALAPTGAPLAGEDAFAAAPKLGDDAPASDLAAMTRYQQVSRNVNELLRTGATDDPTEAAQLRDALDGMLAARPLPAPIRVHRGMGNAGTVLGRDPLEPGTVLTDPGFLSTSTDPAAADRFTNFSDQAAIFDITVPAGTPALAVDTRNSFESEVLLPRGTSLRVVSDVPERHIADQVLYDSMARKAKRDGRPAPTEEDYRAEGIVVDRRRITAEVVPAAAPAADLGDRVDADRDAAAAAEAEATAAAEAKATKKAEAAAKRAAKAAAKQAKAEEEERAARLAAATDDAGVPRVLTHDYLSNLTADEREDLELHLIEGAASGDPLDEQRLTDYMLFTEAQDVEDELGAQEDQLGVEGVNEAITRWRDAHGRPGLTHPAVGGSGADLGVAGVPSMKDVKLEYWAYLEEQAIRAEAETNGYTVTPAGQRLGRSTADMFSGKRGVADVMQYATEELLDWFEKPENRRIAWAEFYYERTKSAAFAEKAAKARAVSLQINRDRTALKASPGLPVVPGLVAAARRGPREDVPPTRAQLDAYQAGRNAFADGEPSSVCPYPPALDAKDPEGRFVLWVRGYVQARADAFTARRAAEGWIADPALERLTWTGGDVLVLPPAPAALAASATDPAPAGHTDPAAGSGPGDASDPEGRPMPRTWKSAPHLAPFDTPTGDGRIFKVGSLTARELPLPLLFQPTSGFGHDGSVVVGRILAVNFTEQGVEASGDYLDADAAAAPDLSKAIEQAVTLAESGLGHVSVDLSDVVGELVDEDGNPVSMEDIFDAWDRGEDPKVLEQVSEGKLIAVTQVATPAFEGAKIELTAAAAPASPGGEAALEDASGGVVAVGAIVDYEIVSDDGEDVQESGRGEVTGLNEDDEMVTIQPTEVPVGTPVEEPGNPVTVPLANVTVVTPASEPAADEEEAEVSLLAAAGPLRPPAEWFEDPKLTGPTALTITDDGRVYGHAALWDVCHVGFSNTCVTPPPSPSGYKHFHTGEVVTADGSRVAVGNLTLGGQHADVRLAYRSAIEHYDVRGAGAAVVRMYEDEFGIAFSGALTPGVTEEQIYDLRRSPVSGDWRRVGGELEMIGVLSVNSPGFPTPRFATDSAGRTALTAAPSVRPVDPTKSRPSSSSLAQLTQRITADVTAAVRAQLAEETASTERAARLRGLAATVRPDRSRHSKLAALSARVDQPRRDRLAALSAKVVSR